MRMEEILPASRIRLVDEVANRQEAIRRLIAMLDADGCLSDPEQFARDLAKRERQSNTAVQGGLDLPHARSAGVAVPSAALLVLRKSMDCRCTMDGQPVNVFLMIASPEDGTAHMDIMAMLAMALDRPGVHQGLLEAASPEQAENLLARESGAAEEDEQAGARPAKILVVTACPTGIAHTYIAAQSFRTAAREMDLPVRIETDGSRGVDGAFTPEEIRQADAVILAVDKEVEIARFAGKRVLTVPVAEGIHHPRELLEAALNGKGRILQGQGSGARASTEIGRRLYKYLMNGISYMLPFVIAGGILMAMAYLVDDVSLGTATFGSNTPLAAFLTTVGKSAFNLMGPVAAGYIAFAIADRPGLLLGFAGGTLAIQGTILESLWNDQVPVVSGGMLAALAAGYLAGGIVLLLQRLTRRLPEYLDSVRTLLWYPVAGLLLIGLCVGAMNPLFGAVNTGIYQFLNHLGESSQLLLGCALGAMMNIDFGGPVNKAAYVFGTVALTWGQGEIMAAVMIGGMVPSLATALAVTLFPGVFSPEERQRGFVNYLLGLCFISEGALPFLASSPLELIFACAVGGGLGGALSMCMNCSIPAPHGGIFVFPLAQNPLGGLLALAVGSLTAALLFALLRRCRSTANQEKSSQK